MKLDVRFRFLEPSEALRDHAVRQVHFHLSRFGQQIRSVQLRISDVNGPKGGVDKQCQVTMRGIRFTSIVVDELSADTYSAIDVALDRAGHAVGRNLERGRTARSLLPSQG